MREQQCGGITTSRLAAKRPRRLALASAVAMICTVLAVVSPAPMIGIDSVDAAVRTMPTSNGWKNPVAGTARFEDHGFGGSYCYLPGREHLGTDSQGAPAGSSVFALTSGTVRRVDSWGTQWGAAIGIEHRTSSGSRFLAIYGHVDASVRVGATVRAGQRIGTLYNLPGNHHLHLGIRPLSASDNGSGTAVKGSTTCGTSNLGYVDPIPYLNANTAAGSNQGTPREDYSYRNPRISWPGGDNPNDLRPNTLYDVRIDVEITGTKPWTFQRPQPVRLGTENPRSAASPIAYVAANQPGTWYSHERIQVDQLSTNTTASFTFKIRTPGETGRFSQAFRAVVEGLKWMESSPLIELRGTVKEEPIGVPGAPTNVTVETGVESAVVSWGAAADNGAPITGYTATLLPGGHTCSTGGGGRSCTLNGIVGGVTGVVRVAATNRAGTGEFGTSGLVIVPRRPPKVDPVLLPATATGGGNDSFAGQGTGFSPASTVSVSATLPSGAPYPNGTYGRSIETDGDGAFGWRWNFASAPEVGEHRITFTDDETGKSAVVVLTAVSNRVDPIAGSINIKPDVLAVGDTAMIEGTGFTPGELVGVTVFDPRGRTFSTSRNTLADADGGFVRVWEPDAPGQWLIAATGVDSGHTSEASVQVDDVLSPGACAGTVYTALANSRFAGTSGREAAVVRLYTAVFLRLPDDAGFRYWVDGPAGVRLMAQYFVTSEEFRLTYGNVDDAGFVNLLYCNVLGRVPDESGLAYWTAIVADEGRDTVVLGFSESEEYRIRTSTS